MTTAQKPEPSKTSGKRYERFKAWHACHQLALEVYRVTAKWPAAERFGMTSQIRRAAFSATLNIAEGAAKRGSREFRRYLDISLGSLSELSCLILLSKELGILNPERAGELEALCDHAGRLTWGLYRALDKSKEASKA